MTMYLLMYCSLQDMDFKKEESLSIQLGFFNDSGVKYEWVCSIFSCKMWKPALLKRRRKKVSLFALFCAPLASYSLPFFSMHINCTILRVCLQLPLANIHVAIMKLNIRLYYPTSPTRARSGALFVFISSPRGVSDLLRLRNLERLSKAFQFFLILKRKARIKKIKTFCR